MYLGHPHCKTHLSKNMIKSELPIFFILWVCELSCQQN